MRLITSFLIFAVLLAGSAFAQPIEQALREDKPTVAQLIEAMKVDENPGHRTRSGASYLHLAVRRDLGDHIHQLMTAGAIRALLNERDGGYTPIEEAIIKNKPKAFVALLSYYVVDAYRMNNRHNWTLVHLAVSHGRLKMLRALHAAGYRLDQTDKEGGWTPLDLALAMTNPTHRPAVIARGERTAAVLSELLAPPAQAPVKEEVVEPEPRELEAPRGPETPEADPTEIIVEEPAATRSLWDRALPAAHIVMGCCIVAGLACAAFGK